MPAKYERLPTEPQLHNPSFATYYPPPYYENVVETSDSNPDIEQEAPRRSRARHRGDPLPSFDSDPRFRQPTPSPILVMGVGDELNVEWKPGFWLSRRVKRRVHSQLHLRLISMRRINWIGAPPRLITIQYASLHLADRSLRLSSFISTIQILCIALRQSGIQIQILLFFELDLQIS